MAAGEHAVAYYARCLGVFPRLRVLPVRDDADEWAAALWQRRQLGERALAIHPGSGGAAKNWEGMAEVASTWRRDGGSVVAIFGPAELERGTTIPADAIVAGEPLTRVAAVLHRAHRYLGNDSGISHLAGLVGANAVVVFGDSDPTIWAPSGAGVRIVRGAATCDACAAGQFCIHRLSVATVRAALR
jgi:ADP-heptose:LPS heptosyltransferase